MNRKQTAVVVVAVLLVSSGIATAVHLWGQTDGDVAVRDDNAPTAVVTCGCEVQLYGFGPDSTVTQVNTAAGNASVAGPETASVRLDNIEGTTTDLSEIDTSGGNLTVDPADKPRAVVSGGVTSLSYRDGTLDDGTADFTYAADAAGTVSVGGLPAGEGTGIINESSGELIDTAVVDSNGRAEYDVPSGQSDVLIQKSPQELTIRPENDTGGIIDTADVEIRFFVQEEGTDERVVTRSTSDGTISMTDLPKDSSFVVTASADGYGDRRIYVDNLFEQQDVYLLPDSQDSVTKVFEYSDFSGDFPQDETVLKFQRTVDGEFETIQGDVIGATGEYRVTMAQGERHRIVLLNKETGERRVQGAFTPLTSSNQQIQIYSNNEIEVSAFGPLINYQPSINVVPAGETTIATDIRPREEDIDSATVTIYVDDGTGTTQISQASNSGPGEISQDINVSGDTGSELVVEVSFVLADGTEGERRQTYSIREQFDNENSLLNVLGGFGGLIPDGNLGTFQAAVSIFTSVLIAAGASSQARISGEGFGLIIVAVLAGWSVVGWIGYGLVFASGVSLASLAFLRRGVV